MNQPMANAYRAKTWCPSACLGISPHAALRHPVAKANALPSAQAASNSARMASARSRRPSPSTLTARAIIARETRSLMRMRLGPTQRLEVAVRLPARARSPRRSGGMHAAPAGQAVPERAIRPRSDLSRPSASTAGRACRTEGRFPSSGHSRTHTKAHGALKPFTSGHDSVRLGQLVNHQCWMTRCHKASTIGYRNGLSLR